MRTQVASYAFCNGCNFPRSQKNPQYMASLLIALKRSAQVRACASPAKQSMAQIDATFSGAQRLFPNRRNEGARNEPFGTRSYNKDMEPIMALTYPP